MCANAPVEDWAATASLRHLLVVEQDSVYNRRVNCAPQAHMRLYHRFGGEIHKNYGGCR